MTLTPAPLRARASAPIAAIDIGSNTVHVTVARPVLAPSDVTLEIIADQSDLVRLGHDIAASGAIGPERAQRAMAALEQYAGLARMLTAQTVLGIATEGVRAAANSRELAARAEAQTGIRLHVITGEQEAALSYWGATSDEPATPEPRGVIDLGGGSLELVIGEAKRVDWRVSLPLGAGAVRDRFGLGNPPSLSQLDYAFQAVRAELAAVDPPTPPHEVAVCGGTAGALAALGTHLFGENTTRIAVRQGHLAEVTGRRILTRYHLETVLAVLAQEPAVKVAARYHIKAPRARLLAAGALVLLAAMERLGVSRLNVSRRGLREGSMLAYVYRGDDWLRAAVRGILE
ncbi:MAG TPA: hypothetical protein VF120_13510 [Ktedonobacterales bacterium]